MRARKEEAEAVDSVDNPDIQAQNAVASDVPTEWRPAGVLETPPPSRGFWYTWVRTHIGSETDGRNYAAMYRQGYRPVFAGEVEDFYAPDTRTDVPNAVGKAVVSVKDMVLMKMPLKMKKQRDAYYRGQAAQQIADIDKRLHGEAKRKDDKFFVNRKSSSELRKAPLDEETED